MTASIACSTPDCPATAEKPADCQWEPLWTAGWRWRGDPEARPLPFVPRAQIYSCPDCPPVI